MKAQAAVAAAIGAAGWGVLHRRAPAVVAWERSDLDARRAGPLHVRAGGSGDVVVVLLHGLVATGDIFGAAFDPLARTSTLVVPDLLGFGRSLDETRASFTATDHLDALDAALDALGLADRPLVIGAHSMGVALAVRWAARRPPRSTVVVGFGAPVYPDAAAVHDTIAATGPMARAVATDTRWAEALCHLNCRHRFAAGLLAAAASPGLPTPVARAASLHTWPAYRDAIDDVVAAADWPELLATLDSTGVTTELVWGADDRIGDRDLARSLPGVSVEIVTGADHHLPLSHPDRCVERLERHLLTF